MLAESKDTAELMVDLAYGAVYAHDAVMAADVDRLWEVLTALIHRMRVVSVLAGRRTEEAEELASVLRVMGAIEDIGRDAVDIARVASQPEGLPTAFVAALSQDEDVVHRVAVAAGSEIIGGSLSTLALPARTGVRVVAVGRGDEWVTRVEGDLVCRPGDQLLVVGPAVGVRAVREAAGTPAQTAPEADDRPPADEAALAVEIFADMKALSGVSVGLAYAALLVDDAALAREVWQLAARLDDMKARLQRWVLRAAGDHPDDHGLYALLQLAQAAEDLGDRAAEMVRPLVDGDDVHPVLGLALGEADEIAVRVVVADGSPADQRSVRALESGTGFGVLAVRRGGRYRYRPSRDALVQAGDEVFASGPSEGRPMLVDRFRSSS